MTAENHRATDRRAQRRLDLAQITNMIFIHISFGGREAV